MNRECGTLHKCGVLHQWFNDMPRFIFPFKEESITLNGIYVLFECGEHAHGLDRIVRVGTHTGCDQLRSRLKQHFINENKDRSIFRKNIGRAILNKNKDEFLSKWELDLTTRAAKEHHAKSVNFSKQKRVEELVTRCIQENFSFVVISVDDKKQRLWLESKIISTVSLCEECGPSENWLGRFSPKKKIRESGLWLVNELYKEPLAKRDIKTIMSLKARAHDVNHIAYK